MTASASGFVVLLLSVSVIQGQNDWGVTYTPTQICAIKGSTVTIRCTFTNPSTFKGQQIQVKKKFWFTKMNGDEPVDLQSDTKYRYRVQYRCPQRSCTLTIKNVMESDSAVYKFRITTNHLDGKYTGELGVTLSVTDPNLHVQVNRYQWKVVCDSNCRLPDQPSYVWYQNGQEIQAQRSYFYLHHLDPANSYSCAIRGHEDFPSPSVCVGQSCNMVTYSDRSVCAFKGSSVEISCKYNSREQIRSKFWFSFRNGYKLWNPPEAEDLRTDSQYTGRVQVLETQGGGSTLRITDLRERDSGQYRFKFKTYGFEWGSSLAGTTLTVTDIEVRVTWSNGEIKLMCHTLCHVLDVPSYVWYKNGQKMGGESSFHLVSYDYENSYSCAVKGHEDFSSRSKCVDGQFCNRVIYTRRKVCALEGSSVDISCEYKSYDNHNYLSKFWFNPDRSNHWQNPSQPEDLSEDSQYASRGQVMESQAGRSTLRITNLRESDSGQYRFKFKTQRFEWGSNLPGTTLTVAALQVQVTSVITVHQSYTEAQLKCHSSCSPDSGLSFVWFKNGRTVGLEINSYKDQFYPGDNISCAFKGHEDFRSPLVYTPKVPLLKLTPSGEIVEGSSVTLTCSSDANPAANYTWYKENQTLLRKEPQLVFNSIQSSDSGQYYCTAENKLGRTTSRYVFVDVKYAPKTVSVMWNPSGEVLEGNSLNLTCSTDANPAAFYTWYKDNQTLPQRSEQIYFTWIKPEDRGSYSCKSENRYGQMNSSSEFIDVQYAPQIPAVSASPSSEIVVGSSVNLTCSSDANPPANYTWYKDDEIVPQTSGQMFSINDIRPDHGGKFYCVAQNQRGRHNSSLQLTVVTGSMKSAAAGSISVIVVIVVFIFLSAFLWMRKKKFSNKTSGPGEPGNITQPHVGPEFNTPAAVAQRKPAEQPEDLFYATVSFSKNQEDPLYSNIRAAQPNRDDSEEEDNVEYTMVNVSSTPTFNCEEAEEASSALYSTVHKTRRV